MLHRVSLLTLLAGVVSALIRQEESGSCLQLETDWQDKLDTLFKKLPNEIRGIGFEDKDTEFEEAYPGLFLSTDLFVGLNNLEPDRPYETFCKDNVRIIIFSLSSFSHLRYYIPWKLCSGHNGTVSAVVHRSRFEGEIGVTRVGDQTEWRVNRIDTMLLEGVDVKVEGLDNKVAEAAAWAGQLFAGTARQHWVHLSQSVIAGVMTELGKKENIRLGRENDV